MQIPLPRLMVVALAAGALLGGCKAVPELPGVTPYRMEIQQGNYVSQDMVDQLKPGMSREQVRFVLGTPLVTDIFHNDRWDYVYYREPRSGKREQRRLVVRFENDRLKSFEGEAAPAPAEPPREAAKPAAPAPAKAAAPELAPAAQPAAPAREANWRAASDAPGAEATAPARRAAGGTDAGKPAAAAGADAEARPEKAASSERGFFGRLIEKLGF